MSNPIRVNNFSQSSWLIVGTSFVSTIIGSMILAQGENTVVILARAVAHSTLEPATINLLVAICALIAALLAAWQKLGPSPVALLILIAVIAIAGMFSSLLFRDDYTGGSCGEFEWPAGHLHAGYPYSWLDGEICVPPHTLIGEYVRQHPEKAGWYPDFPAMFVDLLFWVNIGILASLIAGIGCRITKTMNRVTCAKSPAGIGQEGESEHD